MLKKTIRRLGALAMVLAMAVSVFAVNASATTGVGTNSLTIKKTVTADGNTYAPATTFTFSIATAGEGEYDDNVVYAGVDGGAYFANGANQITYSAADGIISGTTGLTKTTAISTDASAFANYGPGIYHYTVSETPGSYEGIAYDTTVRDLYVYVTNGDSGLVVSNVVLTKDTTKMIDKKAVVEKTKTDEWVNDYGKNNDTIHNVKVTKLVTGNQGNKDKLFTFDVSVIGAENEMYKVVYNVTGEEGKEETTSVTSKGAAKEIAIKHNGYIQIYGLSASDTYTVKEVEANTDGYVTTINGEATEKGETSGHAAAADVSIEYKNEKNIATPGGVIMTIAPYALMVVLAGAFAVVFLTRRNRAE